MAIFFQAKQMKNPHDTSATPLYYARVKNISTLDETELVNRIAARTGVSEGIISSVLRDSMSEVVNLVTLGYKVQLPSLGLVYVTIRSNGSETAEEVTAGRVKQISIRLLASSNFKNKVQSKSKLTNFSKLETSASLGSEGNDDTDNTGEGNNDGGNTGDEENNPL